MLTSPDGRFRANKHPARRIGAAGGNTLQIMKTAAEYRKHAQECRELARQMSAGEQRNQLMQMSRTWEDLAATREALVRKHPDLSCEKTPTKAPVPSQDSA